MCLEDYVKSRGPNVMIDTYKILLVRQAPKINVVESLDDEAITQNEDITKFMKKITSYSWLARAQVLENISDFKTTIDAKSVSQCMVIATSDLVD